MSIQAMKRTPLLSSLRTGLQQLGMATLATVVLASSVQAATDEFVYFHTDALGSPTAAFNEAGEVCWVETYSPYGEKLDKEDSLTPADGCGLLGTDVGYTGHVQDGSGLVYAQQRYYDPVIGRFMSTDPTMPSAGDPRYFGRYQYGGNNPYKYTDPSGKFVVLAIPAWGAIEWGLAALTTAALTKAVLDTSVVLNENANEELEDWEKELEEFNKSLDKGLTNHGKERDKDRGRRIDDKQSVIDEGEKFRDTETGATIHVKDNEVVVLGDDGGVTQWNDQTEQETSNKVSEGKWEPIDD